MDLRVGWSRLKVNNACLKLRDPYLEPFNNGGLFLQADTEGGNFVDSFLKFPAQRLNHLLVFIDRHVEGLDGVEVAILRVLPLGGSLHECFLERVDLADELQPDFLNLVLVDFELHEKVSVLTLPPVKLVPIEVDHDCQSVDLKLHLQPLILQSVVALDLLFLFDDWLTSLIVANLVQIGFFHSQDFCLVTEAHLIHLRKVFLLKLAVLGLVLRDH